MKHPKHPTVDDAIAYLNALLALDERAVKELVEHRVPCSAELLLHPTVQVIRDGKGPGHLVGLLGVLNGLYGTDEDGSGFITAYFDDSGALKHFKRAGSADFWEGDAG